MLNLLKSTILSQLSTQQGNLLIQTEARITKWDKHHYKVVQLRIIAKWTGNLLESGTTVITKWGSYYKVGQLLESMAIITKQGSARFTFQKNPTSMRLTSLNFNMFKVFNIFQLTKNSISGSKSGGKNTLKKQKFIQKIQGIVNSIYFSYKRRKCNSSPTVYEIAQINSLSRNYCC